MKKQKENSHEGITWSEMGKQNVQAEKVYYETAVISSNLRISGLNITWYTKDPKDCFLAK